MIKEKRKDNKNRLLKEGEYQRKNNTYEYRWKDHFGKNKCVYAKTLTELRKKEEEINKKMVEGFNFDCEKITIDDLFTRWFDMKRGIRNTTLHTYELVYNYHVKGSFGKNKIVDIKKSHIRQFYNSLHDNKKISISTIKLLNAVLRQIFELAIDDEYIKINPTDNALRELKKNTAESNSFKTRRKYFTLDEQKIFEKFIKDNYSQWYSFIIFLLWTGLRSGEALGLRWCDIDFNNETISVDHTLIADQQTIELRKKYNRDRWEIHPTKTNSGKRIIPMIPKVKKVLLEEKEKQEKNKTKCSIIIDGYTDFVFVKPDGNIYTRSYLDAVLYRSIKKCNEKYGTNIPKLSLHCLRHTFATRMCESNINIKVIQTILGHSDIDTTMDIYTNVTKEFKKQELNNLDNLFDF